MFSQSFLTPCHAMPSFIFWDVIFFKRRKERQHVWAHSLSIKLCFIYYLCKRFTCCASAMQVFHIKMGPFFGRASVSSVTMFWRVAYIWNTHLFVYPLTREEAGELVQTLLENEDKSRTTSEMADLLYHAMVLLKVKDVKIEEVLEVLRKRFSQSGIEEKSSRGRPYANPSS